MESYTRAPKYGISPRGSFMISSTLDAGIGINFEEVMGRLQALLQVTATNKDRDVGERQIASQCRPHTTSPWNERDLQVLRLNRHRCRLSTSFHCRCAASQYKNFH
ncbi:hypothetical protein KP509_16G043300 [Ceratopteris richardii]|uniref:Uncharacterized protein n=1 Tax=Ceratopteris richardii TaxID=49495 RepID=A0A8T2T1I8_CERRI|nr:hypothetical protein KP509_16G043300 [Ceratopteris richardii]